ncbi:hypothetical protein [Kitasatospora sp. NPDC088351]|uniref:hypothetical protein n=1 Tax=Kitasatospora sp. NPDC088351 TaxID=3155180 RepID=UPI00341A3DA0
MSVSRATRLRVQGGTAPRAFQHCDSNAHGWATESGAFTLRIATSVADPGHTVTVTPTTDRT